MKNLKRVLSLALSGIMLVGMMAVGAGAVNAEDFTDADEITHSEAVSIATALKIIDGKEDGSFDPNGYVTRGQMAKMITRAMFGGEDPVLGVKATPTFTDIKGRWDESYIEYCASNGIINGRGDGTFDPEGNVTGTEAAKMLLSALGYRADIYGLTGPDWALTTNSIANQNSLNLYDELKSLDPGKAFTRDQVAQMIYSALNAETMELSTSMSITSGNVTYDYQPSGKTLLFDKYGAVRVEGVVTANEFTSNSDNMNGKTTLEITNNEELKTMLKDDAKNPTIEVASGKAEFGKAVAVYVKPSSSAKTNLSKATAISDIIVDDNEVITRTKALTGDGKTVESWVKDNGMKLDKDAAFYVNYVEVEDGFTKASSNTKGTEIIAIDNDGDGEVEVVLKNTTTFGKVTKYSTKDDGAVSVRTNGDTTLVPTNAELKDVVAYEGIAVDDYVNVTKVAGKFYITEAEVVEGNLDAFKADSDVTVDGTKYDISANKGYSDLKAMAEIADNNVVDEDVTVYLDAFGYAVAGKTEAATDYLFVANASWNNVASSLTSGTLTAYVYMEDGTGASYVINKIDNKKAGKDDDDKVLGKVFKYSETSDGKLNLTPVDLTEYKTDNDAVSYKKGQSTLTIEDASTLVTTDTVVFLVTLDSKVGGAADETIDKVNVYTGKTAPSMSYNVKGTAGIVDSDAKFYPGIVTVANKDDDSKSDVVVFVNNKTDATGDWLYLVNYLRTTGSGAVFNAIVDGELKEITTNAKDDKSKKGLYEYEMDGELYAIGDEIENQATGFVSYEDDTSAIVAGQEYNITKDTVIAFLDDEDTDVKATLEEKTTVVVYFDNETDYNAKGIFILTEAADGESAVEAVKAPVVEDTAANSYKVSKAALDEAEISDVAGVKALFTVSAGAKVYWLANDSVNAGETKVYEATSDSDATAKNTSIEGMTQSDAITAETYQLVVVSKGVQGTGMTEGYTVYTVTISD